MNDPVTLSVVIDPRLGQVDEATRRAKAFCTAKGVTCEVAVAPAQATGRYVLVMDANLETPVKEVDKLITALDAGADVAIGTRRLLLWNTPLHFHCYKLESFKDPSRRLKIAKVPVMWMKPRA